MKKLFFLLFVGLTALAHGQRPDVLIGNDYESISGFGGPFLSFVPIGGKLSVFTGGGGAILLDNTFYLGGYGMSMADDRTITQEGNEYGVDFGHGGLMLGYNFRPENLIHFSVGSKLGWGTLSYRARADNVRNVNDKIFVVHPSAEVEFNITHWFKTNVGLGYQQVIGVDDFFYDTAEASGPAVSVSLLFGWFY
ncbi:MAG: hypothetical protein AAGA85_11135 [Bacteroidota bacterium]